MRLSMSLLDHTNSIPCPWGEGLLHVGSGASPSQGHLPLLHKTHHSYPRSGEIQWFNMLWWWTTPYQELTKLFGGNFECEHVWQMLKTCVTPSVSKKHVLLKCFVLTLESEWYTHAALSTKYCSPSPGGSHLPQQPVVSSLSQYDGTELRQQGLFVRPEEQQKPQCKSNIQ